MLRFNVLKYLIKRTPFLMFLLFGYILVSVAILASPVLAVQNFNIEIELPQTYSSVTAGSDIWFTVNILNLMNSERVDIVITSEIIDANDVMLYSHSKTVAIETQASFVNKIALPTAMEDGTYAIRVKVNSTYGESSARHDINIISPKVDYFYYYVAGAALIIILIIILLVSMHSKISEWLLQMKIRRIIRNRLKK